jgi:hypothetical protein
MGQSPEAALQTDIQHKGSKVHSARLAARAFLLLMQPTSFSFARIEPRALQNIRGMQGVFRKLMTTRRWSQLRGSGTFLGAGARS